MSTRIKLLIKNETTKQFELNKDALTILQTLKEPVGVCLVAGSYRSGKSYLMNKLADEKELFEIGNTNKPCTKDIWMNQRIKKIRNDKNEEINLIFMDTEGLESLKNEKWDVKLFLAGILISSVFIYNTKTPLGTDALNKLANVSRITEKIKLKANTSEVYTKRNLRQSCPDFVWVVRDNALSLTESPKEILKEFLELEDDSEVEKKEKEDITRRNSTRENIINTFRELKCFYLPLPLSNSIKGLSIEQSYNKLNELNETELNPKFLDELKKLKNEIIGKLSAKMIKSTVLNGNMYVEYLKVIVEAINQEKTVYIQDALEKIEAEEILNEIKKNYLKDLVDKSSNLNTQQRPVTMNELNSIINQLTRKYTDELKSKIAKYLHEEFLEKFNLFKKEKDEQYLDKNKAKIREYNSGLALEIWDKNIKPKVNSNSFQNLRAFDDAVAESKKEFKIKVFDLSDQEADLVWEEAIKKVNFEIVKRNVQDQFDKIERENEKRLLQERIRQLECQNRMRNESEYYEYPDFGQLLQDQASSSNPTYNKPSSKYHGREICIGERGGLYYKDDHGNKIYVKIEEVSGLATKTNTASSASHNSVRADRESTSSSSYANRSTSSYAPPSHSGFASGTYSNERSSYNGATVYTGSRGGTYFIASNGKKRYI